jgi:hypothetical protein
MFEKRKINQGRGFSLKIYWMYFYLKAGCELEFLK